MPGSNGSQTVFRGALVFRGPRRYQFQCILSFHRLTVLYVLSGLTCSSPTFYPQDAFMCFVCPSEKTETFALYIIYLCFFNRCNAYCAVRPESLNKTDYVSSLKGLILYHSLLCIDTVLVKLASCSHCAIY
jgi:hypothetical protein